MQQIARIDVSRVAFFFSTAVTIFAVGMAAGRYEFFPYRQIVYAKRSVEAVIADIGMSTGIKPTEHINKARYSGRGVVRCDNDRVSAGLTLLTGFFGNGLELRLIELDGQVVNQWPVRYSTIWPEGTPYIPTDQRPKTDWNTFLNGALALPDGSVVFNHYGLIKMDRNGQVLWRYAEYTHHSLELAAGGGFWAPGRQFVTGESLHPPIVPPYEVDTIVKISNSGRKEREIPVLDIFWKNEMLPQLFSNNRKFDPNPERDVIHLNDVEELTTTMAVNFPQFEAGDLLLSLRQPNMLMVIDPDTQFVKWFQVGPWIQQHDGDWQPDGMITVFNNNFDASAGSLFGGSNIVGVNPTTRKSKYIFGLKEDQSFFTGVQGDHQFLGNGNLLISESKQGRVFEVTAEGEMVWEYINRYSETEVLLVSDAVRYPHEYFEVDWDASED